ncbi:MAG: SpaA isopeptide-forming pilin-related protein, partial [Hominisplanchenecus sp.]
VAENLITGDDGSITLSDLYLGTYTVKEKNAPENFVNKGESKNVTLSYNGQTEKVVLGSTTFQNDRQKASVSVVKVDNTTKNPLSGGIYGLYAAEDIKNVDGTVVAKKDTFIEKAVTGADGRAAYTADIPIGFSYYVKELQAPDCYVRNMEDIYHFTFSYTHDTEAAVSYTHTFENERVNAKINLVKKDAETGSTPQGDATLEKAVYGLYAREDVVHPDGKTGVIYKAGTQIATLTTDKNGEASVGDLYLGRYYVKEITPSNGYLLDEKEYDLSCDFEGDLVATVERTAASLEQVIKQPFQLIKVADNGKTDADLLSGAGFTAYLESSLKVKEDGSYDFDSAEPVVIGENGAKEIFTDKKGYAVSIAIPFGTYIVKETTTPHNFKPVKDFVVRITENHPTEPQTWRVLLDEEFHAKLKIIKQDDETKKSVLAAGTEFKVFDLDNQEYVEQVTTYPTTVTHTSYFTDSEGYLILPNSLLAGSYRIEEITAPDGYTVNRNYVEIKVDTDTMYQIDQVSGDAIIEVVYENHPVKGELQVIKKGEVLSGYGKDFEYEVQPLAGASFSVYAAEDIYTADFQEDANGDRICEYHAGELVAELTTGEDGKAILDNLPLGTYRIVEVKAPDGYVLNGEEQEVTFSYADQETAVITQTAEFINARQRVEAKAVKKDAENGALLSGAVFGLYAKEDITAGEKVIVKADTLLAEAITDKNGSAVFEADLPFASYYVKEHQAPEGYVLTAENYEINAVYQGQDVPVAVFGAEFHNHPTVTEFTKSDITTGTELDGATLTVLDKDKNIVDTWTSVKEEPHVIKRLHVGETYILREEFAPYGYLKAEEVEFTVADTTEMQKVEMKDDVPTALLIINKEGEFLDKVTMLDNAKGTLEHLFEYVSGSLTEVTFEVYAAEDIKAADGVSEDYYKADELVATITTDTNGIAQAGDLPVGKYYVKEVETAHGYVLDGEPRYVDLSYRDQDTPIVTYSEAWQNARQKTMIHVWKKEKGSERVLKGGVFGLFTAEDIKAASGTVLVTADTMIERRATDDKGEITFTADLPVDGKYYIQELAAPDGFVTTDEKQEFTFEYQGALEESVSYDFVFENEPTTVELTKADLTTSKELPGAHLRVIDENGDLVDEWVSGNEPHIIKELTVGKSYALIETKPADGYVTAESIDFVIENTADIQKHTMLDDVTKVKISKTDITGTEEIPGAKLTILDENDQVVESWTSGTEPHYVEKLPVGQYKLREERAPKGYVLTEDVVFQIVDSGEIQTVQMKDDTAKGKIILNKTDQETGKPLKGVEFEIRDSKDKVLETLKTDSAGHAESSLYEIASYKNGKYDAEFKYYLVETKTLDGYKLDDTKHEIVFHYADDTTPVIEVKMNLENEEAPVLPEVPDHQEATTTNAPKTGDNTPILPLAALMAGAVCCIAVLLKKRKKNV